MNYFRLADTVLLWVLALVVMLWSQAIAEDQLVQVRIAEAEMFRSPAYDGEVIRTALEGEEFLSVTEVGEFYLVEDPQTEWFRYRAYVQNKLHQSCMKGRLLLSCSVNFAASSTVSRGTFRVGASLSMS